MHRNSSASVLLALIALSFLVCGCKQIQAKLTPRPRPSAKIGSVTSANRLKSGAMKNGDALTDIRYVAVELENCGPNGFWADLKTADGRTLPCDFVALEMNPSNVNRSIYHVPLPPAYVKDLKGAQLVCGVNQQTIGTFQLPSVSWNPVKHIKENVPNVLLGEALGIRANLAEPMSLICDDHHRIPGRASATLKTKVQISPLQRPGNDRVDIQLMLAGTTWSKYSPSSSINCQVSKGQIIPFDTEVYDPPFDRAEIDVKVKRSHTLEEEVILENVVINQDHKRVPRENMVAFFAVGQPSRVYTTPSGIKFRLMDNDGSACNSEDSASLTIEYLHDAERVVLKNSSLYAKFKEPVDIWCQSPSINGPYSSAGRKQSLVVRFPNIKLQTGMVMPKVKVKVVQRTLGKSAVIRLVAPVKTVKG